MKVVASPFISFSASTFTGKETDCETGFSYFGARYYDPTLLTSWTAVDPMSDKYPNITPYAYCNWNPVKLIDPNGMEAGDYINVLGKKIGTDGKNDKKIYVVISNAASKQIIKNTKNNKVTPTEDLKKNSYLELPLIEIRKGMMNVACPDNDVLREYGGAVCLDQNDEIYVCPAEPGPIHQKDSRGEIDVTNLRHDKSGNHLMKSVVSRFHSHDASLDPGPSDEDKKNVRSGFNYVFNRSNNTVVIYDSRGPIISFSFDKFLSLEGNAKIEKALFPNIKF